MSKVAIFQCGCPLQVHTVQLARMLALAGYAVDLYLNACDSDYVEVRELADEGAVNVIDIHASRFEKVRDRLLRLLGTKLYTRYRAIVPQSIIRRATANLRGTAGRYYIGVEKRGLIWAEAVARVTRVPFIYYSLELYIEDHPSVADGTFHPRFRQLERDCHARARATIIQDPLRAAELTRANRLGDMEWIYFPVSVAGPADAARGDFFHRRFDLAAGRKVLLYLGVFSQERASAQLAVISRRLPDDYVMILHGQGDRAVIEALQGQVDVRHFLLSLQMVAAGEVGRLIASAHIGLALYRGDCANDELTAFASEKVALYCRAGVPFIAFANRSFRQLFDEYPCGVLIGAIDELPAAVRQIDANYGEYSRNALLAFAGHFDAQRNFAALRDYLDA